MRSRFTLPFVSLLLLFATLITLTTAATARAADTEDDYDDYEETARVVRISLIKGEVSLRRAGNTSWESARLNMPLVEGDQLATERDARVEIQIDARNFVRVAGDSVLRIVTLRDEGVALSLIEGTATLRLARFESEREYFEVDAPGTTMAAEKRGLYRLDATRGGKVRVTVRDGGRARIYSETSGFTLRDRRSAELVFDGDDAGDWQLTDASAFDDWDNWTDERERYLASRLRYEDRERYYDRDVWGAEELDAYGDWSYVDTYGWVWRPHVTVINHYSNWAPYRYGHWAWVPPYGWTWVADEPWGWAPYHYGRWVYHNNHWYWAPRGYGYKPRRSWWRPALVAFVYVPTSYGEQVCWYPLTYGQRDPRSRRYRHHDGRLRALRRHELANLQRTNPAYLRAVSSLPARDFGASGTRARPAATDIARRAVEGEPVRGNLPITRADANRRIDTTPDGRARLNIARPAPARALNERPTGAAERTPGVALDSQLRRARIFNNRDPRRVAPDAGGSSGGNTDGRNTGAVARPARPSARPSLDTRGFDNDETNTGARPSRPVRSAPERGAEADDAKREGERLRRPGMRDRDGENERPGLRDAEAGAGGEPRPGRVRPPRPSIEPPPQTSAPRIDERPAPRERSRPAPVENPEPSPPRQEEPRPERPAPRVEREAPRYERPAPRYERAEPRVERPQQREERPQREERQQQREERHESRPEPPPRQEAPPPPPREESPPARQEPPPARSEPAPRQSEEPRERSAPARPQRSRDNDNE